LVPETPNEVDDVGVATAVAVGVGISNFIGGNPLLIPVAGTGNVVGKDDCSTGVVA
jgi:hypothetical protein